MPDEPRPAAPSEPSLLAVAIALARAGDGRRAIQQAVQRCALSLEYHLDTLARELGAAGALDPRLRRQAEEVASRMRELLVRSWALHRRLAAGELVEDDEVQQFAGDLQLAAEREIAVVFEQLNAPSALD